MDAPVSYDPVTAAPFTDAPVSDGCVTDAPASRVAAWAWLRQLPSSLLIGLVRVYQFTLSPLIGRSCRFEPTCSHYFIAWCRGKRDLAFFKQAVQHARANQNRNQHQPLNEWG